MQRITRRRGRRRRRRRRRRRKKIPQRPRSAARGKGAHSPVDL